MDNQTLKEMARELGVSAGDLYALAPQNDPFNTGRPADYVNGEWFADLWRRFRYGTGVHIRRVHYQVMSQDPPVLMPPGISNNKGNGQKDVRLPYINTEECWRFLSQCSKTARYLKLIPIEAFVDRRNPSPRIYTQWREEEPSILIDRGLWDTPTIPDFPATPRYWVNNYIPEQRYHLELWAEKSTMDDILVPLCERFGVNLVTGLGELSITAVLDMINRSREERPARICYISDFDPAGRSMPVAVSRKIEWFLRDRGLDEYDIRLFPIVLTSDQVQSYRLPRTPIKDNERRAGRFEEVHGEGAVELDALEALYPGALSTILTEWIEQYYDQTLARKTRNAQADLEDDLEAVQSEIKEDYAERIEELEAEYNQLKLNFDQSVASIAERMMVLWDEIENRLYRSAPDINDYPVPEAEESEETGEPLYDSSRSYLDQIFYYKDFQGKEARV